MFLKREDMEEYMMSTGNMIHKVCRTSIKSRAYRGLALRAPLLLAACRSSPRTMVPSPSPRRCCPTPGSGSSGLALLTSTYIPEHGLQALTHKECGFEYLRRCVSPAGLGRGHPAPRILAIHCNVECRILNSLLNVLCSCRYQ